MVTVNGLTMVGYVVAVSEHFVANVKQQPNRRVAQSQSSMWRANDPVLVTSLCHQRWWCLCCTRQGETEGLAVAHVDGGL